MDGQAAVHWSSSAGQLVSSGDEVSWTLPDGTEATLTASLETKTRLSTSTFRFRLGTDLQVSAAPAGAVDGTGNATGTSCDLAFDPSNNPVMIYRNDTHPAVWYAKWNGSAWQTELVDGMGYEVGGPADIEMSLALAPDGTPHVAYAWENGEVHYATKSGSAWTRERVDTSVARYDDPSSYVSIALDPAHSNRPVIAYEYAAPQTVLAVRTGANTWTNTASSTPTTYLGGLAISAAGTAFFVLYDGGMKVASWTGSGNTFVESPTISNSFFYHQPMGLALDSSTRPVVGGPMAVLHVKPGTGLADATITTSPFEESSVGVADLTWAGGKPYLAINHNNNLELVTTDANGYWMYTSAGTMATTTKIGVAVDSSGVAHACFQRNGFITYQ